MGEFLLFWILQLFVFLVGVTVGHSVLLYKIRQQEGKNRSTELKILERRQEVLRQGKVIASDLEEALYKARIQQEIDDIIRKGGPSS
ncbi:MAG: hypothetical protein GF331_19535 [Chitinivibrionales bacterium]|nr:hypothetical protein [Chitinivibrionales bacterium]